MSLSRDVPRPEMPDAEPRHVPEERRHPDDVPEKEKAPARGAPEIPASPEPVPEERDPRDAPSAS